MGGGGRGEELEKAGGEAGFLGSGLWKAVENWAEMGKEKAKSHRIRIRRPQSFAKSAG